MRKVDHLPDIFSRMRGRRSASYRRYLGSLAAVLCVAAAATPAAAQKSRPPAIVTVCAPCHGSDGMTGTVVTPNLAGQKSIYLRQQLLAFRSGKRKHPDMKVI